MTVVEVRGKNGRLYARRFDYDEARARHAAGEKVLALAVEYGVTESAVWQAITPGARERHIANQKRWCTGLCESCGGPAMRLVSNKREHNPDGRTLCLSCRSIERRTAVIVEGGQVVAVKCHECKEWLAPERFPKGTRYRDLRPGGFHNDCRSCLTAIKRAYRDARKVACTKCGGPRDPDTPGNNHYGATGLCRPCYLASPKAKRA